MEPQIHEKSIENWVDFSMIFKWILGRLGGGSRTGVKSGAEWVVVVFA